MHKRERVQLDFLSQGKQIFIPFEEYLLPAWFFGGNGPLVILCHGWQGSAASWFRLAPALVESGFQVLAYNAPGHHNKPQKSSLPHFCGALTAVLDRFPAQMLVGHSFGAMTVAKVAARTQLEKVVLISSPNSISALARGFAHNMRMSQEAEIAFLDRLSRSFGGELDRETVVDYFSQISASALLVHDDQDDVIPISTSRKVSAEHGLELVETSGLGHRQIIRDDKVCKRVLEFLN